MLYPVLRRCRALLLAATLGSQAMLAHAVPENGWWWNPAESGRGYFIEVEEGVLVMAAYFYEEDGRGTWLLSAGAMAGDDAYSGRLLSLSGGQTLSATTSFPPVPSIGAR